MLTERLKSRMLMDRGSKRRHFSHDQLCLLCLSVVCADEMCSFGLHMALLSVLSIV